MFAAAFLVKAPVFPLHGWMPDAYRAAPLPVLVVFSAVVSKIGVYGFLRIVLPVLPDAAVHFQDLMLAFAVVSILYGSVIAFAQDDTRLVVGYSSIAQLGFILLGIFALEEKGAQGAVMQMVNHGIVAAGLFFAIAALARRAGGSELLSRMGGMAFRAPALAALLLILAFANLAMPGTANFVGELLILFGAFEDKLDVGPRRDGRRGAGVGLHDPVLHPGDAQPAGARRRVEGDLPARARRDRAARRDRGRARRVPAGDPRGHRAGGRRVPHRGQP